MSEIDNGIVDEVPIGWSIAKGSDLFDFVRGVSYSKNDATFAKTKGHTAILRAGNLQDGSIIFDDLVYVPNTYVSDPQKLRKGDLVIAMSSGSASVVGKVAIVNEDMNDVSFGAFCGLIRPRNETVSSWLRQYFQSGAYRTLISSIAAGININNLKREHLADLDIPLPPLLEIPRVATKLEAMQARSRKAREALEAIPPLLEQFRQSVLAAAFRGDLTAGWREQHPDVEPAGVLLERIRIERRRKWEQAELAKFKAKGKKPKDDSWKEKYVEPEPVDDADLPELPMGWCWTSVGSCTWSVKDGPHVSPKYTDSGIPFISGRNVRPEGVDFSTSKYISPDLHATFSERCKPEVGDILYTKGGTTGIARVNTYDIDFNVWVHVAVLKLVPHVLPFYMQHSLNSRHCYDQAQRLTHGVGNQDLGLTRMVNITLALAPLKEQRVIVERIDAYMKAIRVIEENMASASAQLKSLDQSILTKAFRGELVPQDSNDEPAAQLLERIQAERTAATDEKETRRRDKGKAIQKTERRNSKR